MCEDDNKHAARGRNALATAVLDAARSTQRSRRHGPDATRSTPRARTCDARRHALDACGTRRHALDACGARRHALKSAALSLWDVAPPCPVRDSGTPRRPLARRRRRAQKCPAPRCHRGRDAQTPPAAPPPARHYEHAVAPSVLHPCSRHSHTRRRPQRPPRPKMPRTALPREPRRAKSAHPRPPLRARRETPSRAPSESHRMEEARVSNGVQHSARLSW